MALMKPVHRIWFQPFSKTLRGWIRTQDAFFDAFCTSAPSCAVSRRQTISSHRGSKQTTTLESSQVLRRFSLDASTDIRNGNAVPETVSKTRFGDTAKVDIDGDTIDLNVTWLRENCRCPECYNAVTCQKNVLFHRLDQTALMPDRISYEPTSGHVTIAWKDGHESVYGANVLKRYPGSRDSPRIKKLLWNAEKVSNSMTSVKFDSLISGSNKAVEQLAINLYRFGFGFVEDTPANLEDTVKAVKMVSTIRPTFYGYSWQFGNTRMDYKDTAYTDLALGAHTDGTYYESPPGMQVFHCIVDDCSGGETLLVDGFHAAELLRSRQPEAFEILTSTQMNHVYLDAERNIVSRDVMLRLDSTTGELRSIRYNPYDRRDFTRVPQSQVARVYDSLEALASIIEDPANMFWVKLRPGTILIVDNWRVLHGRAKFSGKRQICGCYLDRDEWSSKLRILGLIQ